MADNAGQQTDSPSSATKESGPPMDSPTSAPTLKRYVILSLIFITVVINYLDRTNISVAELEIREDLGMTKIQMGYVFSAFGWTYMLLQIPGGIVADVFRPRAIYAALLSLWSVVTILQAFCTSTFGFVLCRLGIGAFEAPAYPINNRIVTKWFPERERATAIAIYTSGQFLGLAALQPLLSYLLAIELGWQMLFIISGVVGLAWAVVWIFLYRDPENHPSVSQSELDMIAQGGGLVEQKVGVSEPPQFKWDDLKTAFAHRKLWGIYISQFCLGTFFVFFLTWFPTYLKEDRGIDVKTAGYLAALPFIAGFFGVLMSGTLSDYLTRKNVSAGIARKAPVLTGMILSAAMLGVNYVEDRRLMITFLCLAFFGYGLASINWVFVSLIAPKRLLGLVGGVFNFFGGIAAILTPIIIGYAIEGENGSFEMAFFYISAVAVLGFCSYIFLVGRVERIEVDDAS